MDIEELSTERSQRSDLICRICGDIARGFNFQVITCMSCKSFFRRNAFRLMTIRRCQHHNRCDIRTDTRASCPACRLRKCYTFGMNPRLIQSIASDDCNFQMYEQLMMTRQNQLQLLAPQSFDLFPNNYSELTNDQWNLLSNITHVYDEQNMINRFKYLLNEKSSLQPKLRFKLVDTFNVAHQILTSIQPLIKHSFHFQHLSPYAQRALIFRNVHVTGILNAHFVVHESNSVTRITYLTAINAFYGPDLTMKIIKDVERLEQNGTLVKLMLFVLTFSSNCSVVTFNKEEDWRSMSNSIELICIQDIYVTLLWKYFIYLYGYNQAVIRYFSMINYITDLIRDTDQVSNNENHHALVDSIVAEVEHSLVVID